MKEREDTILNGDESEGGVQGRQFPLDINNDNEEHFTVH